MAAVHRGSGVAELGVPHSLAWRGKKRVTNGKILLFSGFQALLEVWLTSQVLPESSVSWRSVWERAAKASSVGSELVVSLSGEGSNFPAKAEGRGVWLSRVMCGR